MQTKRIKGKEYRVLTTYSDSVVYISEIGFEILVRPINTIFTVIK